MDWLLVRALIALVVGCVGIYGVCLCLDDEHDLDEVDVIGDDQRRPGVA